jgi:acyl-CoA synthetase (AMP-forming)/AMP-acid ligase II
MLINRIFRHAHENPDRLALVNNGKEITYAAFACAIDATRNHLMGAGLPDHGVIVRLERNFHHDWVLLLALRSLGLTVASAPSWQYIERLDIDDITGVVCLSAEEPALHRVRTMRPDLAIAVVPLRVLHPFATPDLPSPLPDSSFGNQIVCTSGTTGNYKMVLRDGSAIEQALIDHECGLIEQELGPGDFLHCHEFETWSGPGYWNPIVCWIKGATAIFDQRPDRDEHFNDYPVKIAFVIPGRLPTLKAIIASRPADYPPLRLQIGGGFVNSETVLDMIDAPNVEFYVVYGGTEFGIAAMNAVHLKDDLVWLAPTAKPGLEIVDEDDRPVPVGLEGNIRLKSVPSGRPWSYLGDSEASDLHFRDGWFYPGDMAVQREDGRIRILGRVQDVLNLGGQKIPVAPIEESIRQSLGLENVCVFAVQNKAGMEALAVVIEASQFPDRATLKAAVEKVVKAPRLLVSKLGKKASTNLGAIQSVEIYAPPGSTLSGNQHPDSLLFAEPAPLHASDSLCVRRYSIQDTFQGSTSIIILEGISHPHCGAELIGVATHRYERRIGEITQQSLIVELRTQREALSQITRQRDHAAQTKGSALYAATARPIGRQPTGRTRVAVDAEIVASIASTHHIK